MRRSRALLLALLAAAAPAAAADDALRAELTRDLKGLALPDQPRPYYLAFSVVETRSVEVAAQLGDLTQNDEARRRYVEARVRVGSPALDNTNFAGGGWNGGAVRGTTQGDDQGPLIRDAWLAADAGYKQAVQVLAGKQAVLRREPRNDRAPDFGPAAPVTVREPAPTLPADLRERYSRIVRDLSAVFRATPAIQAAEVRLSARAIDRRLEDSEGFDTRTAETSAVALVTAETQAADGTTLKEAWAAVAPDPDRLDAANLLAATKALAERLVRRTQSADLPAPYLGPVYFTPAASAELVRQTLATDLPGTPAPLAARALAQGGQLAKFLGQRILPAWMDVTDDPTRGDWNGTPLMGRYAVDHEGVAGRRVDLVVEGRLRAFLMSRTPSTVYTDANGHGRLVGGGMARAAPANLLVLAKRADAAAAVRKRLLKLAADEGLDYALEVRHLHEPAVGGRGPRRINVGSGDEDAEEAPSRWALSPALDLVRLDVRTGAETPVRGALFGPLGIAEFRSLVAATRETAVYSFVIEAEADNYYQAEAEDAYASIVAPGLLFAQLEVRPLGKKRKPLPLLLSPLLAAGTP